MKEQKIDIYAENEYGLKGGCGRSTKDLEEDLSIAGSLFIVSVIILIAIVTYGLIGG